MPWAPLAWFYLRMDYFQLWIHWTQLLWKQASDTWAKTSETASISRGEYDSLTPPPLPCDSEFLKQLSHNQLASSLTFAGFRKLIRDHFPLTTSVTHVPFTFPTHTSSRSDLTGQILCTGLLYRTCPCATQLSPKSLERKWHVFYGFLLSAGVTASCEVSLM